VYIYIYIYICTYKHTYTHTHAHIHIHTHTQNGIGIGRIWSWCPAMTRDRHDPRLDCVNRSAEREPRRVDSLYTCIRIFVLCMKWKRFSEGSEVVISKASEPISTIVVSTDSLEPPECRGLSIIFLSHRQIEETPENSGFATMRRRYSRLKKKKKKTRNRIGSHYKTTTKRI